MADGAAGLLPRIREAQPVLKRLEFVLQKNNLSRERSDHICIYLVPLMKDPPEAIQPYGS